MGISRNATAHWEGDLKTGKGKLNTPQSGLLAEGGRVLERGVWDAQGAAVAVEMR